MSGLVELLGIEGSTKAKGDTWAEEDVVGNSSNTTVVDLGLGEGDWVESVLGGNLKTDVVAALGVPDGLGTSLNLGVDLVVVRSGENAQVAVSSDGSAVLSSVVSDGSGVLGDSCLLDIVTSLGTGEETIMADNGVNVSSWALKEVEESTSVEVWLLEVEVDLGTLGLGAWKKPPRSSALRPLAMLSWISILVSRALAVFQTCVRETPERR